MRDHCSAAVEVFAAFFRVFRSGSLVGQALLDGKSWTNLPNSVKLQASQWCWRRGRKRERKRVPRNGFIDFSCYCWFVRLLFDIWNVFIKHIKHKKHLHNITIWYYIFIYSPSLFENEYPMETSACAVSGPAIHRTWRSWTVSWVRFRNYGRCLSSRWESMTLWRSLGERSHRILDKII